MLKINKAELEAVRRHGEETYPHECCGVLLGRMEDEERQVVETVRCGNTREDRPQDRYNIDPRELVRIQRQGHERGLDIVGFYHSHPDHPAQASRFDTERAWAGYVYLIVAIHQGNPVDANAFVADADGGPFQPEPLEVV